MPDSSSKAVQMQNFNLSFAPFAFQDVLYRVTKERGNVYACLRMRAAGLDLACV